MLKRLFFQSDKKLLGRWSLKTCDEIKSKINVFYNNRDHCGDKICGQPEKFKEFKNKSSEESKDEGSKL